MPEESNTGVTLARKPDRRQTTRGGFGRHTDRITAAMWMRVADALARLREAAALADAQRSRSVLLRERAREQSARLATTIAAVSSARQTISN